MKPVREIVVLILAITFVTSQAAAQDAADPKLEKERQKVRKIANDTLKRLYKAEPAAKGLVEKSAGYAVFSDTGVKILVSGSGKGQGVAVNNRTKAETFMKMFELQVGLGFGVKKFKVIFVFDNDRALSKFVDSGWEFGGQADAAAKAGEAKGALPPVPPRSRTACGCIS